MHSLKKFGVLSFHIFGLITLTQKCKLNLYEVNKIIVSSFVIYKHVKGMEQKLLGLKTCLYHFINGDPEVLIRLIIEEKR